MGILLWWSYWREDTIHLSAGEKFSPLNNLCYLKENPRPHRPGSRYHSQKLPAESVIFIIIEAGPTMSSQSDISVGERGIEGNINKLKETNTKIVKNQARM